VQIARAAVAFALAATLVAAAHAAVPKPTSAVNRAWAGYVVQPPSGAELEFTAISATWKQPRMMCRPGQNDAYAIWVGLGGYGSSGLEQTGVGTACPTGKTPVATPWYEVLPAYASKLKRRHVAP